MNYKWYGTLHDVIVANEKSGQGWFENWANSAQLQSAVEPFWGGCYFITSYVSSGERLYTLHKVNADGTIRNVGDEGQYEALEDVKYDAGFLNEAVLDRL